MTETKQCNLLDLLHLGWCREGGSNPHDRKGRRILSPLRLPVPPSRHGVGRHEKYRIDADYQASYNSARLMFIALFQGRAYVLGLRRQTKPDGMSVQLG